MVVLSPEVPEEEIPGSIERVAGLLSAAGGEISSMHRDSPWGRRRLAYPIRHNGRDVRDGFYVLYYFDLESAKVSELERELRLNDQVIRHMVSQQVAPAPSPEVPEDADVDAAIDSGPPAAQTPEAEIAEPAGELASEGPPAATAAADIPEALESEAALEPETTESALASTDTSEPDDDSSTPETKASEA
jgi:small subunit ribosomal protein S6